MSMKRKIDSAIKCKGTAENVADMLEGVPAREKHMRIEIAPKLYSDKFIVSITIEDVSTANDIISKINAVDWQQLISFVHEDCNTQDNDTDEDVSANTGEVYGEHGGGKLNGGLLS